MYTLSTDIYILLNYTDKNNHNKIRLLILFFEMYLLENKLTEMLQVQ